LPKEKEDKPFTFVDIMPEFPGGEKALLNFLSKHIKYPLYAVENKIEGTVIIEFIVKTDGSISNAEVLQDVKGGCSEEALRVVNSMPKWKPGMQNGIPVAVYFTIPIEFELPKEKEEPITWADEMPVFPGGEQALIHYLKENLIYPQVAKEKKIEGTVVVEFRIKSTGEVSGVKVLESIGSGCDEEGIRLVENMPKWKPGKQNGKPIAVYFTLPIEFKLP
nr:energy transducer TonB [Chitinophagales bacterium]